MKKQQSCSCRLQRLLHTAQFAGTGSVELYFYTDPIFYNAMFSGFRGFRSRKHFLKEQFFFVLQEEEHSALIYYNDAKDVCKNLQVPFLSPKTAPLKRQLFV